MNSKYNQKYQSKKSAGFSSFGNNQRTQSQQVWKYQPKYKGNFSQQSDSSHYQSQENQDSENFYNSPSGFQGYSSNSNRFKANGFVESQEFNLNDVQVSDFMDPHHSGIKSLDQSYFHQYQNTPEPNPVSSKIEYDVYQSRLPQVEEHGHHDRTPACLLQCVKWVMDIEECAINDEIQSHQNKNVQNFSLMDPASTRKIASIRDPMVSYKNCTFGNQADQSDMLQQIFVQDRFNDQCITKKSSQNQIEGNEIFIDKFSESHNQASINHLNSLGQLTFPIKNKSKSQNTHITNFQFELNQNLKQETFMLCFDLVDREKEILNKALKITDGMTGRQFMFKIQGYAHGQTVFTDHIHYLLKGGKLMKCTLDTINEYRQMINNVSNIPPISQATAQAINLNLQNEKHLYKDRRGCTHEIPLYDKSNRKINYLKKRNFLVKVQNLPKQFGFEVEVKNLHFDERKAVLAKNLVQGQSCISKLFFVFNINDILLDENSKYHCYNQNSSMNGLDSQHIQRVFNGENIVGMCINSAAFAINHIADESYDNSQVSDFNHMPSSAFDQIGNNYLSCNFGENEENYKNLTHMKTNLDSYLSKEDQIQVDQRQSSNCRVEKTVYLSENIDLKNDQINDLYLQSLMALNNEHCETLQSTKFNHLVQALNPKVFKDDSESDEDDDVSLAAVDDIFRSFRDISINCLKIFIEDLRIEMVPSLSSINLVRKFSEFGNSFSNFDTTPLKNHESGNGISEKSTTGTGFKHQFGSETTSNDNEQMYSKLQWSNPEQYPMNRQPLYMQLQEVLKMFQIEMSEIDKENSWFAVLFSHHKTQKVLSDNKEDPFLPRVQTLLAYYRFTDDKNQIELFGLLQESQDFNELKNQFWHFEKKSINQNMHLNYSMQKEYKLASELRDFIQKSCMNENPNFLDEMHGDFWKIWNRSQIQSSPIEMNNFF